MPLGPFQVMTYLVACPETREAVIIDPAGEEDKILDLIQTQGVTVKYILNTHGHSDHVLGNPKLKEVLNVPVCMHEADDRFFSDPAIRDKSSKELGLPPPDPADIRLKDEDILEVGTLNIKVIPTPGHTPGSVCYLVNGNLFCGDTLFVGAVGRTEHRRRRAQRRGRAGVHRGRGGGPRRERPPRRSGCPAPRRGRPSAGPAAGAGAPAGRRQPGNR